MKKPASAVMFLFLAGFLSAQPVEDLQKSYSGKVTWQEKTGTIIFKTTGAIYFEDKTGDGTDLENAQKNHFWAVPKSVKHILIDKDVTVTGAFHTFDDIIIEGKDRKTSVIYGCEEEAWADRNNPGGLNLKEWFYSQIENNGGVMYIRNLTIRDPFSYFVRGSVTVIHMSDCDLIDKRNGHQNHSDGFIGGDGSTVDNCYFECGDDVFKTYKSYSVSNCTIMMRDNCVPIQLGWGSYSDGSVCNFTNLKIIGNSGRGSSDNAVICGRRGTFTVEINIDGIEVDNPNAVWVSLWQAGMTLRGEVKNADIKVGKFTDRRFAGKYEMTICGSGEQATEYRCQ